MSSPWILHYAASRFNRSEYSYFAGVATTGGMFTPEVRSLMFFDSNWRSGQTSFEALPPSRAFDAKPTSGVSSQAGDRLLKKNMAILRERWSFPLAPAEQADSVPSSYLAIKGGCNTYDDGDDAHNNHGHYDVGSFILESQGVRFLIDFGHDSYDLQGYFGKQRFNFYRLSSHGHNLVTLGGMD